VVTVTVLVDQSQEPRLLAAPVETGDDLRCASVAIDGDEALATGEELRSTAYCTAVSSCISSTTRWRMWP
jgi:hypothetical protein